VARNGVVSPFVAAFIGGHLAKRWPQPSWADLLRRLLDDRVPVLVFIGAEEVAQGGSLQARVGAALKIVPLQHLRAFAAMLAHATVLITPDSGPMHLAAALGVPTIALLQRERSWFYVPRGAEDRTLFQPRSADVLAALQEHPRWHLVAPKD
jgi:heptosyltransferase-3